MKRFAMLFLFVFVTFVKAQDNPEITAKEVLNYISFLASDEMEGRFTGSEKCYQAGEFISNEYKKMGVLPLFDGEYFQKFDFVEDVELGKDNSAVLQIGEMKSMLKLGDDYTPTGFSGNAKVKAPVVFAGYGITAPKLNYDDYSNISVKNKIVVVMRYNPESSNPHSEFDKYSSLRFKATTAQSNGALGMIIVNGHSPSEEDNLFKFRYDRAAGIEGFPVVHVKRNFIEEMFSLNNKDFADIQNEIDSTKNPHSFDLQNCIAELNTEVNEVHKTGRNVGGLIKAPGN
ncbi:MAG: aminopeptidase, partial [Ignavibacteria bacterium]